MAHYLASFFFCEDVGHWLVFLVVLYYTMMEDGYRKLSVGLFAQVADRIIASCL